MSTNTFSTSDTNRVQLWARSLEVETLKATAIAPLMGEDEDSIIQIKNELTKDTGDKVTYNLVMQLSGDGRSENEVLEGNEEAFTLHADSLVVNELRHAVRVEGDMSISTQRVAFNLRMRAKGALRDWYAYRYGKSFFNQVCGNVAETRTKFTGMNAVTAASSTRILRAGGVAGDNNLTSSNTFNLNLIDYAKEMALTATPMIRPVKVGGDDVYVCYLDPKQVTDLRINTSVGQWLDLQKAAYMGSRKENPIFDGSLGFYNGVVLRMAPDGMLPSGLNGTTAVANTKRAVFLGAQAACIAFSKGGSPTTYRWVEKDFDYDQQTGIAARTIFGLKKTIFNSTDYGSIVISTYAAAHTGA